MLSRRTLLAASSAALATQTLPAHASTDWPQRPVRIVVPYPPGGAADILARLTADGLREYLPGINFVIDNRSGAGSNIGNDFVCKSPPDGYTILSATIGAYAINPFLYARLSYDAQKDLAQATMTYELPNVAVVSTTVPVNTLAEFVAWAKARPNGPVYGSPGVGTSPHMSGVMYMQRAGIENATHVPFRGVAETLPAMLRGDVHFAIDNLPSYIGAIRAGQVKALAITSADRWPTMNSIPTMKEAGVDDFVVTSWANFAFPSGTPRPILDKLSAAQHQLAANPAHRQKLLEIGAQPLATTPEETTAFSNRERARWESIVKLSGARVD